MRRRVTRLADDVYLEIQLTGQVPATRRHCRGRYLVGSASAHPTNQHRTSALPADNMRVVGATAARRSDHGGMSVGNSGSGVLARSARGLARSRPGVDRPAVLSSSRRCRGEGGVETERPPRDFPLTASHIWHTDLASLHPMLGEGAFKMLVPEVWRSPLRKM
jgi:hypothetical protein